MPPHGGPRGPGIQLIQWLSSGQALASSEGWVSRWRKVPE